MNFLSVIPDALVKQAVEEVIKFLSKQAEKYGEEKLAEKIQAFSAQATLRNSFKEAINHGTQRFVAEYINEDEDLVEALGKTENLWDSKEVQKALFELIRSPGTYQWENQKFVSEHFKDVLPTRVNRERVERAVYCLLGCIAQELWALPGTKEIREVYNLQLSLATAEATKLQVEISRQNLEATRQLSDDLRKVFLQLIETYEQNLLKTNSAPSLPSRPHPYHNLPRPDYVSFIGRETELSWLRVRLSPEDRAWQIAITGIGGVGKSSLALAIGHEYIRNYSKLLEGDRFEAIIWISAKEEVLTAQGKEKAVLPGILLRTMEDVFSIITRVLGRDDIARADSDMKQVLINATLRDQRILLIIDNLESVKDDRIKPFLRNLPQPSKAIITSREWIDVADVLKLKGLPLQEADDLIQAECLERGLNLSSQQRLRIYDLTEGLPLAIKLGVARLSSGDTFAAVDRWLGNATGELPQYCVHTQAEDVHQKDPNTWQLLLACSLFDRSVGASAEALGEVTNLSLADRDKGLGVLQRLFLINRTSDERFWELPIVQRYSASHLANEEGAQLVENWILWLIKFSNNHQTDIDLEIPPTPEMEKEFPNILNAIRWCYEKGRWEDLYQLAENSWSAAFFLSLFQEFEEIVKAAHQAALTLQDEDALEQTYLQLSRCEWLSGRPYHSQVDFLHQAETIFRRREALPGKISLLAARQSVLLYLNKDNEAEVLLQQMIKKAQDIHDDQALYSAYYHLGIIYSRCKDFKKAGVYFDKAEQLARTLPFLRNVVAIIFRRGENLFDQELYDQAEPYFLQALEMDLQRNEPRRIAYDKSNLGRTYAKTGRLPEAKKELEDALSLFIQLGMQRDIEKTTSRLEEVTKAIIFGESFPENGLTPIEE